MNDVMELIGLALVIGTCVAAMVMLGLAWAALGMLCAFGVYLVVAANMRDGDV